MREFSANFPNLKKSNKKSTTEYSISSSFFRLLEFFYGRAWLEKSEKLREVGFCCRAYFSWSYVPLLPFLPFFDVPYRGNFYRYRNRDHPQVLAILRFTRKYR
nr:MAG TPA: hypothetical protein [Caudoviricetes sp.]